MEGRSGSGLTNVTYYDVFILCLAKKNREIMNGSSLRPLIAQCET